MSITLRREPSPWWVVQGLALLWGGGVLLAYSDRSDVAVPVVSLLQRALDLWVPVLIVVPAIGVASWLTSRCFDYDGSPTGGEQSAWIPLDHFLYTMFLAIGLVVATMLLLASIGLLQPTAMLVMALLLGVGSVCCRDQWRHLRAGWRSVLSVARTPAGIVSGGLLVLSAMTTLTPAVSQDALHYHLEVPKQWLAAGGFSEVSGNVYSRFPMNIELLFAAALEVRGEIAAKACHWWLAVLAALTVVRLARRWVDLRAAAWGGVIFLAIPTVFRVSTWAYVEMGMVLSLLLAWNLLLGGHRSTRVFLLLAYVLGFACGVKYTLLPVALVLGIVALVRFRPGMAMLGWGVLAANVGGGAWYWRNLWELGNPVFPFLYGTFGGANWDPERAQLFMASLAEWGQRGWDLPLALTFEATFASVTAFDGILGPVFLLALPLMTLAAWRESGTRTTFLLCAGLVALWLSTTRQMRFLVPTLALLAALIPVGWCALREQWARRSAHALVVAGVALGLIAPLLILSNEAPLAFALGLESAEEIRARNLPGGDADLFARIPEVVPPSGKILFAASGNPVFLCDRPYHADSVVENHTLRQSLAQTHTSEEWYRYLTDRGFTHLLFRFQLVFGPASDLSDAERVRLAEALNAFSSLRLEADDTRLYELHRKEGQ